MGGASAWAAVAVVCALAVAASAQRCEPANIAASQCARVISYPSVYIPEGLTQGAIDSALAQQLGPLTLDILPTACLDAAYSFFCTDSLRSCEEVDVGGGVIAPVPSPPCRATCDLFVAQCGDLLLAAGLDELLPDCAAEDPVLAPLPRYPSGDINIPGIPDPVSCTGPAVADPPITVTAFSDLLPGTCEGFAGAPLSQCDAVIPAGSQIFVPRDLSQAQLDALAAESTGGFLLGATSSACTDAAFEFVCASAFRPCQAYALSLPGLQVELPAPPCRDSCTEFVGECGAFLTSIGRTPPDCAASDENGELYPASEVNFSVIPGGNGVTVQCNTPMITGEVRGVPPATCVEPSPSDFSLSQCQAVVDYPVYVPEGLTLADLDEFASSLTVPARIGLLGEPCRQIAMPFLCSSVFRPCSRTDVQPGLSVLFAEPPCRGTCEAFTDECASEPAFLAAGGLPSCDEVDSSTGLESYPESSLSIPLGADLVIAVPCNANTTAITAPYAFFPKATCQRMQETSFSQCDAVVEWPVFVPAATTQKALDFQAHNSSFVLLWRVVPDKCSGATLRLVCAGTFLGCETIELFPGLNLTVPRAPCKSVCDDFNRYCEETLTDAGEPLRDCSTLSEDPLVIPVSEEVQVVATCTLPSREVNLFQACPPYTTTDDEDDDDTPCVAECPSPTFTDSEYLSFFIVTTILGWLGLVAAVIVVCSYATNPWKRQYPRSNPAWQQFYTIPLSISYLIPSLSGGLANAWCYNGHAAQIDDTPYCIFNAWLLYFGAWSGVMWYCFVGLSLNLLVFGVKPVPDWLMQVIFHSTSVLLPIVWLVVFSSTKDFTNGGFGGCRIDGDQWNEWFQDVWFWGPYCVLFLAGCALMAIVTLRLLIVIGLKGLHEHWRTIAYLLIGLSVVGYTCIYHWAIRIEEDSYRRAIENLVACSASELEYERCKLVGELDYAPYLIQIIVVELVPVVFAFILLSDPAIYMYWVDLFRRYILRHDVPDRFAQHKRARALSARLSSAESVSSQSNSQSQSQF